MVATSFRNLSSSAACSTFNSIVSQVLKDLPYTAGYFDDVLIHSHEWNSHLSNLRNVFLAILKAGMKINFEFRRGSVDFLGFRVGLGRIKPRARKVEAILNFPKPSSKKMLAKWNGLASYFQ